MGAQEPQRLGYAQFHGSQGNVQSFGDFFLFHALQAVHFEALPLCRGQLSEGGFQPFLQLGEEKIVFRLLGINLRVTGGDFLVFAFQVEAA